MLYQDVIYTDSIRCAYIGIAHDASRRPQYVFAFFILTIRVYPCSQESQAVDLGLFVRSLKGRWQGAIRWIWVDRAA